MRKTGFLIAAFATVIFASGQAWAQASQAAFRFADIDIVTQSESTLVEDDTDAIGNNDGVCEAGEVCINPPDADSGFHTVLRQYIKAPKGKDLWMNVSLECGNFTQTQVKSKGGNKDTSVAGAMVRVRVKVTHDDGSVTYASPSGDSDRVIDPIFNPVTAGTIGVVYCKRTQELSAVFQGLFQDGDPFDAYVVTVDSGADDPIEGIYYATLEECQLAGDAEVGTENTCEPVTVVGTCLVQLNDGRLVLLTDCLTPEELELVVSQMTAASFNFLAPNLPSSGVNKVEVQVITDTGTSAQQGSAKAMATVGLGSMVVQVLRLVKDSDGSSYVDLK